MICYTSLSVHAHFIIANSAYMHRIDILRISRLRFDSKIDSAHMFRVNLCVGVLCALRDRANVTKEPVQSITYRRNFARVIDRY